MIFVDSNIPMYLGGAAHPKKIEAQLLIERFVAEREVLVTDAEVLQEIVHRYVAIDRIASIDIAFQHLFRFVDHVLSIERQDVLRAAEIVKTKRHLSARDALHVAVMEHHRIERILSFDADYDRWPGMIRIWKI